MGKGWPRRNVALAIVLAGLAVPAAALAAFPGGDPAESPRANAPDDPGFDPCELDDVETPGLDCASFFSEDYRLFGFSPDTANSLPLIPPNLHPLTATQYANCAQLDAQGRAANVAAGDPQCAQISGIRADTAWKRSTGDPDVVIAVLDTGIRWQQQDLVNKIHLNTAELPLPQEAGGADCGAYDCNGDGSVDVRDYADDPRVADDAGETESDAILDASDLIAGFSDGSDADANGYVDDIAGWDFFDDDNDPFDASSLSSWDGHGTGRAGEAAAEADNGVGSPGICPECQVMPLRIWDSFVVPTDFNAMAVVYAADNGASVAEVANGGLTNTRFARAAYSYADSKGVALMSVSSDINSANHNYPTNYNEAIYVGGAIPDTVPLETCGGLALPFIGEVVPVPPELSDACDQVVGLVSDLLGIPISLQPQTTSFFRNANLTQYGGKADIVLMGSTGSENTGQAAGAAGLLASLGREVFGDDDPLSGNEIRQLLTMTAEDVLPANTGSLGSPDRAEPGWDTHFGYGRVNLAAATERIEQERIPPEAQLDAPDWFAPINVERVPASGVEIRGHAAAPHSAVGVGAWEVEYACGQDALDSAFQPLPGASGTGAVDGILGTLPKALLESLADTCNGEVQNDAGRPGGTLTDPWPADPYPDPDPERHAFQIRLTVHEQGDAANFGRYRKTLFAYRDDGNLSGWPKPVGEGSDPARLITGSGGEVPPRLFDLDGDNLLDVLLPTSSGELYALGADGTPLPGWNGGEPVTTRPYALADAHGMPAETGVPRETLRAPAIGDVDGDLEPEVVATAGEHVYAWERDGSEVAGFPVLIDRSLSEPCLSGVAKPCFDAEDRAITADNHIKRGFFGAPALADLDADGRLDIVAGSLDGHVYAWDGTGQTLPGFPVKLATGDGAMTEIVTSPAIAQLDGVGPPEIVLATNEVVPGDPQLPANPFDLINVILGGATGSNPVYALHGDGTAVDGWPVTVGIAAGDLLPMVLPGHDASVFDRDGDGSDEVVVSAGTSLGLGGTRLVDGDGSTATSFASLVGNTVDPTPVINLADYTSIGALSGTTPSVVKGGLTLNGAANLLIPGQNLPFAHVVQAWDPATGLGLPGYPRATDDFQLLSQPAIAKVDAGGSGRQVLYPTGLYQLHAYGSAGTEPAGWPKFLGGWAQATPSVGDVDGDGKLDVAAVTREGWSFLWGTEAPACGGGGGGGTNEEWWTFHHDEHGTANYGHDARPPGTARGLEAIRNADGSVLLRWGAPGDDWLCGKAEEFRVILDDGPIDDPQDGTVAAELPAGAASGALETSTLTEAEVGDATHAAVLYRDEAGNWGLLRGIEVPPAGDDGGGGGGGGAADCANRIRGTGAADLLRGTAGSDRINGRRGNDRIKGRAGDDCLKGGRGHDKLRGGAGDDVIRAARGARDRISCGSGDDVAFANPARDVVKRNCEVVRR